MGGIEIMLKKLLIAIQLVIMMSVTALAADPIVLKFATVEPPFSLNNKTAWIPLFEKINKDAAGILKIELYQGGTLGRNPTQYIQMLKTGVIDIAHIINPYFPGQLVDDWIINIPFIAKDCFECSMAVHHMQEEKLLRGYEELVVLGQVCVGQYGIHTTFPVKVPGDLKGVKLRTAGKFHHQLAEALGATPVAIPVTKVAESISRGVVGGTLQDWTGMEIFRIIDVARCHCVLPLGSNAISVVMTKKKYNSLPENARAIFDKYKGDFFSGYWAEKEYKEIQRIVEKVFANPKHMVYTPNLEEVKQWNAVIKPVIASWIGSNDRGNELVKGFEKSVDKARAMK
jgi:TRAP-type C4-dicarboxylate transport system substrate-binding protein